MEKAQMFQALCLTAQGLAQMFGQNCETVVQEPVNGEIVTLAIYNGQVSGRSAPTTEGILGGTLAKIPDNFLTNESSVSRFVRHPSGKLIKSSSFLYHSDTYTYILGVNLDITAFIQAGNLLGELTETAGSLYGDLSTPSDRTPEAMADTALLAIGISDRPLTRGERLSLLSGLKNDGYFSLQKSVPVLAEKIHVSKFTIYKDLKELD